MSLKTRKDEEVIQFKEIQQQTAMYNTSLNPKLLKTNQLENNRGAIGKVG